jgi:hypothetical protein
MPLRVIVHALKPGLQPMLYPATTKFIDVV